MMLELHNIKIGELISSLSMAIKDGQLVSVVGEKGSGKTTLLRAILGLIPIDDGHISIDGELLTPKSAPYFRRQMAYVPQHLSVPEGYDKIDTSYVALLEKAVASGKKLLLVDEPEFSLSAEDRQRVSHLLGEALQQGATIVAVNSSMTEIKIRL